MALFDLRKRRNAKKDALLTVVEAPADAPAPAPEAEAAPPPAPPAPVAVPVPLIARVPATDPGPGGLLAPAEEWAPALRDVTLAMLDRPQSVLLLGLAPWGTTAFAQRLVGRARGVVVVDPDQGRLKAVRTFVHKTVEAPLESAEWLTKLGDQRFGAVILGDGLTHLADPLTFLRRARELVAADGCLIAVVPNAAWGERRLDLLQGELPREFEIGAPLHRYNHDRLREALALAGFAIAEVCEHRTGMFEAGSELVPELFPDAVVAALGPRTDAATSHFVVRAVPASPEALLRTLFAEQETLRKAVRNELAKAARTADTLTSQLKASDYQRGELERDLEAERKKVVGLTELTARAEQNIGRLGKEADDAMRELRDLKDTWAFRLMQWFRPAPKPSLPSAASAVEEWKVEEPKSRYL